MSNEPVSNEPVSNEPVSNDDVLDSSAAPPTLGADPFTTRAGAVGTPPLHYGNPLGEQRALASGDAIVDLSDRAVISVTGPDRLTWLDSLTSQSLTHLTPGSSAETLLLDPTGRLEHAMRVIDDGVTTWLLVDGAEGGPLAAWLDRMRFMLRVEVVDRSHDFLTIGTLGTAASGGAAATLADPAALPAASPNGVPLVWADPWREVVAGGHQYASADEHPASSWTYSEVLIAPDADLSGFAAAGTLALEALRIAAWRPRLTTEADERTIPHELDWLRSAVHLNKGCYRGQETVAKVHNLGHPPRRLVMLHLDGSEGVLPAAGSEVSLPFLSAAELDTTSTPAGNAPPIPASLGLVTSSAIHYELGPIALAVIKRSVDPSAELIVTADDIRIAAAQEVIVPTDAGAEANVPRLPRLGAVTR